MQSHTTSGTPTFVQHALVEALTGDQSHVEVMRKAFEERGEHMWKRLSAMRGVSCVRPSGAFYCFPNVSQTYGPLGVKNSGEFCDAVLEKANVALVPGDAFGSEAHVRLSFANGMDYINKGLDRLERLLGKK
ncbi:MAG: aminotransferase class I/II-fold pyridoxal phosphate-dependent enzyme [Planctomycetes bacterium]|nr:aminotransferase class I/II-fold pyridoxal phosphate-dependent enzyme [Planctomycetota bacterium]